MSRFNHDFGAALLEQHLRGKHRKPPVTTVSLPYPSSRLVPCGTKITIALILSAIAAYLISEIPHTPGLTTKMTILAGLGIFGAVTLTIFAMRDAMCRLIVDDAGVRIAPLTFGQALDWSQIQSWRMSETPESDDRRRRLVFWIRGMSAPRLVISVECLSYEGRRSLRKALLARLGDQS